MDKGVNITYDTLFELLLREKSRAELQKLEHDFLKSVEQYLKEKKAALNKGHLDVFSEEEKEKTEKQIKNFNRILKEMYERREKKIVELAMIKAKSASAAIDTSSMMPEEKSMFDEITKMLCSFRQKLLIKVINGEAQSQMPAAPQASTGAEESAQQAEAAEQSEATKSGKMVKFTHEVPKFLGKELEIYGPFNVGDTETLPSEIADILISKGRAEEISG